MYLAADVMSVPTIDGVDPADWWRTLICLAYYTGLRCSALMSVEYSMVDNEWINVPARLSKRRKGKRQYLHPEAIEHIDGIRSERAIILAWPRWATTKRTAYLRFRQLQNAAGINKSRQWAFQSFRKTHLTMLAGLSLKHEQGLAVAQHSAGAQQSSRDSWALRIRRYSGTTGCRSDRHDAVTGPAAQNDRTRVH
jgi:integrase